MKFKTTKKNIRDGYYNIISVGYCELQSLLNYESPIAYSSGSYGWYCDYYDIDGVCICTGYSPIGNQNSWADYDLVREYEKKAQDVYTKVDKTKLLNEFIEKATRKEAITK